MDKYLCVMQWVDILTYALHHTHFGPFLLKEGEGDSAYIERESMRREHRAPHIYFYECLKGRCSSILTPYVIVAK